MEIPADRLVTVLFANPGSSSSLPRNNTVAFVLAAAPGEWTLWGDSGINKDDIPGGELVAR
jgi:hypothetical protein